MASWDDSDVIMMIKRSSIQGYPIKDACSNTELVVMTTFDGCVYTCDPTDVNKPENYVKMIFPTSKEGGKPEVEIVVVCCGRYHFLALSRDGRVYSWGRNTVGQLGIPLKKMAHKKQNQPTEYFKPRLIRGLSAYDVIQIACGDDHSLALTRDGRMFSWGCNSHGQLGVETEGSAKSAKHHAEKPMEINGLSGVPLKHIAAGGNHSVALSTSGSVFVWGRNAHGQLGLQEADDVKLPVKLGSMSQGNVNYISCGSHHTSFLKENGKLLVYGMGVNRRPCESDDWSKSELRPGEPDRFRTFSYVQSTSRCTYAVDEFTGGIFVVKHDTVQSGNFQLVALEEGSITDLFEPVSQTDWPPGHYAFDPHIWEDFQPFSEETRRCDVAEVDEFGITEEQEEATTEDNSDDSVDGTTNAYDIAELGRISEDADDESVDEYLTDCMDDAYSDSDSFVTCDDDFVRTVSDDFLVETVVDESGTVIVQENSQRPPRTWRRMCTGLENIFIIEHDEPVGEEVHISFTPRREIDTISAELLQSLSDLKGDFTKDSGFQVARKVFSSPACINASFRQTGPHEVNGPNIDLKAARRAFELISNNKNLLEKLSDVITFYLCSRAPQSTSHEEALRFYLILMECPIFSNPDRAWSRMALAALGRSMGSLGNTSPDEFRLNYATLAHWWKFEPQSFGRTIRTYRLALAFIINDMTLLETEVERIWTYLKVLSVLNEINIQNDIQSICTFYIPNLDQVAFKPPYSGRKHSLQSLQKFSWMSYPFLMNLEMKAKILADKSNSEQENAVEGMFQHVRIFWRLLRLPSLPRLPRIPQALRYLLSHGLIVRRDDVFGSARKQLAAMLSYQRSTLQIPLRVTFEGESGVDGGALRIDFFRLAFEELLDLKKNDLFRFINDDDSTHSVVWFGKDCDDSEAAKICGLLFGLSLYNKAMVPLPFPHLLYAKLLGKGPKSEMGEVAELDKEFAYQMSELLNGSEEYVMGCCYGEELTELNYWGTAVNVPVTKENVHLFVEKKLREYLVPSQFAAFQQGFERVYDPVSLKMFRPIELEKLVNGEKNCDWTVLEQSTKYVKPYRNSHPTIKFFWEVFHALDDNMKRKFLVFVSGSDRVPAGGLRNFGLHIENLPVPRDDSVRDGKSCSKEERLTMLLPQGHGCDNYGCRRTLKLPMYKSLELMEDRLLVALSYYDCPFHIA